MSKLSISAEILSELFAGGRRQKGGAGHSANEQKGRKVSILILVAFTNIYLKVLLDYRQILTNTSDTEKCMLALHFGCKKFTLIINRNFHLRIIILYFQGIKIKDAS